MKRGKKNKNNISQQGVEFCTGTTLVSLEQTQLGGEKYLFVDFESRGEKNTPVVLRGGYQRRDREGMITHSSWRNFLQDKLLPLVGMSLAMHTGLESAAAIPCWVMIYIPGAGHGLEGGVVFLQEK